MCPNHLISEKTAQRVLRPGRHDLQSWPFSTFVAVDIPEPTKQKLLNIQENLYSKRPNDAMKYPPAESFHLTLFYLGDTPPSLRSRIENALITVGMASQPFSITVEGGGTFTTDEKFPRVFFVKVSDPSGNLQVLCKSVRRCLAQFNYKTEYPVYHPHITLCKASSQATSDMLSQFSTIGQDFNVPFLSTIVIKEMIFYQSVPNQSKATYIPLIKIPLTG